MDTRSCKNVSRDLFDLSPLSNKCNREENFDKHVYLSYFFIYLNRDHIGPVLVTVCVVKVGVVFSVVDKFQCRSGILSGFNLNFSFFCQKL